MMLSTMVAALVVTSGIGSSQVFANSLTDMKDQKNELDQQKNELNTDIETKEVEISETQTKVESIQAKIAQLSEEVGQTNESIATLENQIAETIVEVENLQASIADLEQKILDRDAVLRDRVRAMQANGGSLNYVDVLLGANSFSDFIDRVSAVNTLVEADRDIMAEQAANQKQIEEEKVLIEEKLAQSEVAKAELEELQASLETQKAEQDVLATELLTQIELLAEEKEGLEVDLHEVHEISAELEGEIKAEEARYAELARQAELEKQQAAEAERQAAEAQQAAAEKQAGEAPQQEAGAQPQAQPQAQPAPVQVSLPGISSGGWTRPAAGRVSSGFGPRSVKVGSSNHKGIDIANPVGTPVIAAADGVVSRAGTLGSFGTVVMITHSMNGQTFTSVYAHLSIMNVSAGQRVSKGQQIGAIGMTGTTSGPHLHFEIHVGGYSGSSAVNPTNYISF